MNISFKNKYIKITLIICSVAISAIAQNKSQIIKFNKKDYPGPNFVTTEQQYLHGNCLIRIIHVKNLSESSVPTYCRAWLNVEFNNKIIHQIYLDDIEPVGAQYGLFVPRNQPNKEFFTIVKFGDYDGKLYLVDKEGNINDFWGGAYFITIDKKFMISEHHSDLHEIEVIDLMNGKSFFRCSEQIPDPLQWYYYKTGLRTEYFFVSSEHPDLMYVCDFVKKRIRIKFLINNVLSMSTKIKYDFELPQENDCGCAEQLMVE